jgi:hypothetical protein
MADELKLSINWTYDKNGRTRRKGSTAQSSITITGNGVVENVQSIPNGGAALDMGNVTTPSFATFHNASATKYIKIGTKDGAGAFVPFLRLLPTQEVCVYLDDLTITGTNLLYAVPEDATAVLLDYMICDR